MFLGWLAVVVVVVVAVCGGDAAEEVRRISDVSDFYSFANSVADGTNYSGATVYLDADIDLAGQTIEPIGDSRRHFQGTFDGQGHTISNLTVSSKLNTAGLFGYSNGLAIRNVVMDESCSVVCSSNTSSNVGGIIGSCYGKNIGCDIKSVVSMASVTFKGFLSESSNVHLGGIVGYISSSNYESVVKNCAIFGPITQSGESNNSYIGSIVGSSYSYGLSKKVYVQNCLNYGTITHNGTTTRNLYIGGIIGKSEMSDIKNCISVGKIISNNYTCVGTIIGYAESNLANVAHSFWTSDVGDYNASRCGNPTIDNDSSLVELSSNFINKLNSYSANETFNKWLLNTNNGSVTFIINDYKGLTLKSQLILLPGLADNNERSFSGWFIDEELTSPFTSSEVESDITLYGVFCGSNYTVTLDVNGGNALETREMNVECNGTYGSLPQPNKTGHRFAGWFTEKEGGDNVESGDRVVIFNNHTLYVHWVEVSSEYVEIVFGNKALIQEEAEEIIREYTDNAEFSIAKFESNSEGTVVIIKFVDKAEAESFVEKIRESSDERIVINRVKFITDPPSSFSSALCPFLFVFGVL